MVFCLPKDKERLNIKKKCLSGAFFFNTAYSFLNSKPPVFMVSLLINESEAQEVGISKLEGPVTYSTRSEFKVIGSSESQLKFDSK
jgi:hypothetical protein